MPSASDAGATRIAAGRMEGTYMDPWGHRWESDRYFEGGVSQPGPLHLFPPVADGSLYSSIREAVSITSWSRNRNGSSITTFLSLLECTN